MFKAEVILASRNTFGQRITTMLLTFPRYILAELNTHRMLSKNSASSRAIPFEKMVKAIEDNPFIPIAWMKDHKGMQGNEYITDERDIELNISAWLKARDNAISSARYLNHGVKEGRDNGVTKQLCNRLLEPFAYHTVLVTATEWENFFALRAHKDADIHMQKIAKLALEAYNNADVQPLEAGEWHIPFFTWKDVDGDKYKVKDRLEYLIRISTARCAQTSYTVIGEDEKPMNHEKLISLHHRLLVSGHMSPFEHCARAMTNREYFPIAIDSALKGRDEELKQVAKEQINNPLLGWCKNFRGFIQYRAMIAGENKSDSRVKH